MSDLVGQTLGQYNIIDEIARGGMATVYRARQTTIARDVAIKVLPAKFTHERNFLERFNREVAVISQLQHPHILPVYDFGEYDEMPYIVMAYINGGILTDKIKHGAMSIPEIIRMIDQMAQALDFAHTKNIVHRDFKPSNVLLDTLGNTYLADFGLAKLTSSSTDITGSMILGTPDYIAPEQAKSGEITKSADIYALGVTIYQMLTGQVPYDAPTASGILVAHITEPVPDIHAVRPDLPHKIQKVIENSLAKDPMERYQSTLELARDLKAALNDEPLAELSSSKKQDLSALLMTNMLGHVIFADNQCLHLLRRHQNEARQLIGKPLAQVLGIESSVAKKVMSEISQKGEIQSQSLEITDSRNKKHVVNCSAVATRDDDGTFVGADITLTLIPEVSEQPSQTFNSVAKSMDTRQEAYIQNYFAKQIDALYELLIQWAGRKVAQNLEDILNETGQRNVWAVSMHNGNITMELKQTDAAIYQALLARAMAYAASIIGTNQVIREMEYVNKSIDPAEMNFVQALGLDQLYKDILK